jgi:hypothetical protein
VKVDHRTLRRLDREDRWRHKNAEDWLIFQWEQDLSPEQVAMLKAILRS